MRTGLIGIALALGVLACFVVLGSRRETRIVSAASDRPRGPWFELEVVRPLSARPLFGILPSQLEAKIVEDADLGFGIASPGAENGRVGHDRLELRAEGWDFFIQTDGKGRIAPGTHLVFPVVLADKQRKLRCQPAEPAVGHLRTSTREGTDGLDGQFLVELATCENLESGRVIEWPPAPLTVRGSFVGLTG